MSELPAPFASAEIDCTDLDGFMLNVERLMASELVALASHEAIAAALFLWCRAWKQKPAASLPNDDRVLAAFARLPLARFKKIRHDVMRGFVLCSDGRLYHRVLADEARNAFARKMKFRDKRETDAKRLREWREEQRRNAGRNAVGNGDETVSETRFVQEGQGQGQYKIPTTSGAPPPECLNPLDAIWTLGVQLLGDTPTNRSLLGKLAKEHGESVLSAAIGETIAKHAADPRAYLLGVLKPKQRRAVV